VGMARFDPKGECLTDIDGGVPSMRCSGYGGFVGRLHEPNPYPTYGENVLTYTNGSIG
jgi:hypothetical protein